LFRLLGEIVEKKREWGLGIYGKASAGMGGADGVGTRFGDCGNGPVIVKQACGAVNDVLSDRGCGLKRKHLSIGRGAAPRWTTSPSGRENSPRRGPTQGVRPVLERGGDWE